jgi:hypothetical protein
MPFIGRLDEQVNDMLIAPLERNGADTRAHTPEQSRPPREAEETETEVEKRAARDELPVWLL